MYRAALLLYSLLQAQLSGLYYINGNTDPTARTYASIQAALDELAAQGAQDSVVFRVVYPYDPAVEPATIRVRPYACTNCEVLLLIDTVITIAKAPPPEWWLGQFVLRIQGGVQRFTLNGRGKLTLRCLTDTTAFTGVVGILPSSAGGISRIRIDSCIIEGLSREKTWTAIYIGDSVSNVFRPVPATTSQITISACTLRAAHYGAAFIASGWGPLSQISIQKSTFGYPTATLAQAESTWTEAAIFAQFVSSLTIDSCLVEGCWYDGPRTLRGVYLDRCNNVLVRKNTIRNLRSLSEDGFGAIGIHCVRNPGFGPSPHLIENNYIGGLIGGADESLPGSSSYAVAGILLESLSPDPAATFTLRHNTIHLYGTAETSTPWARDGFCAGVVLGRNIRGGVELSSNLIQNTLSLRSRVVPDLKESVALVLWENFPDIQWSSFTFRHNFYFVEGGSPIRSGIARIGAGLSKRFVGSLAEWRSVSGQDIPSVWGITGGAPFLMVGAPHIDPTVPWLGINRGTMPLLSADDIDGESRPQGGINDAGTAPDIGADELAGTAIPCLSPTTQTLTAAAPGGLVGETVSLSVGDPSMLAGELLLAWSVDGGQNWHTQSVLPTHFPVDFRLPVPPTFPGSVILRLIALPLPGCPEPPDTSAPLSLSVTDRPGNRPQNAIPLTFTLASTGLWIATHTDSLTGPGITDVYSLSPTTPNASLSPELFFSILTPDCIDSLEIDLCSEETDFDTRLHLIGILDTITDRDQGYRADCTPTAIPASLTSRIIAIGSSTRTIPLSEDFTQPARAMLPLPANETFRIAVEGDSPIEQGHFTLTVRAHRLPLAKPDLGPDRTLCLSPMGFTLSGFTPGANAYQWFLNGQLLSASTDSTITLLLPLGTHTIVVEARREPPQLCAPLLTARDTVVLTVIPSIQAQVRYGSELADNGDTLHLTFGTHTLTAEAQAAGVSFGWRLWDSRGILIDWHNGTSYEREWGERGTFLIELESRTPECTEIDSIWIQVRAPQPSSLSTISGAIRVYPNPASDVVYVEAPMADSVELYDLRGICLGRYPLSSDGLQRLPLTLSAGSYLLRFHPQQITIPLLVCP